MLLPVWYLSTQRTPFLPVSVLKLTVLSLHSSVKLMWNMLRFKIDQKFHLFSLSADKGQQTKVFFFSHVKHQCVFSRVSPLLGKQFLTLPSVCVRSVCSSAALLVFILGSVPVMYTSLLLLGFLTFSGESAHGNPRRVLSRLKALRRQMTHSYANRFLHLHFSSMYL